MSIKSFNKDKFKETLKQYVSAAEPVRSIEHLVGREEELQQIEEALCADGRHVFIYGDRGVGKSSLAASAASQYQSSDNAPIQVTCGHDTKFYQTIESIADRVITETNGKRVFSKEQSINVKVYSIKWEDVDKEITFQNVDSMFTAVEAIAAVAKYHSDMPVIIIDEFDQIDSDDERGQFASFLKGLGDRGVNIKFIFTGVASSLNKLLGSHESSYRQLLTIQLPIIYWGHREEIIYNAVNAFSLVIDENVVFKITRLSNGFPYYIHLIVENLLWLIFNKEDEITKITNEHFQEALIRSIKGINAQLQRPYDKAVMHKTDDIYEIVWATADSESTERYIDKIYESYKHIRKQIYGINPTPEELPLPKEKVAYVLRNLRNESYGNILVNHEGRKGLYSYRENVLRGFVAMKALEAGVELRGDVPDTPKMPTVHAREKKYHQAGGYVPLPDNYRGRK